MNAPPSPNGILVIDKPLGPTSMDVCRVVRRALIAGGAPKRVKVGHGGTLDPLATGVLVVLVGKATRMCDQVMDGAKQYTTRIDLSAFSTTDDAEGERTVVPVATPPAASRVAAACEQFVGVIQQRPPIYSAIKIDGRRAYDMARKGQINRDEIPVRPVRIDAIRLDSFAWPIAALTIDCGKGVYIRSLARSLGEALGTGGMLISLRRTRVGRWDLARAISLDSVPKTLTQSDLNAEM